MAGGLARAGKPLAAVAKAASSVAGAVATMGVSASPCVVPGRPASFQLPDGKVELGLGIHGEAGFQQVDISQVDLLITKIFDCILSTEPNRGYLAIGPAEKVAVMINNLGGTSNLEMAVIARGVMAESAARGLEVVRCYSGALMTSLQMSGFSITLFKLGGDAGGVPGVTGLLDAGVKVSGWPASYEVDPAIAVASAATEVVGAPIMKPVFPGALDGTVIECLKAFVAAMKASEPRLTELDAKVGDGDMGKSVEAGAAALDTFIAAVTPYPPGPPPATTGADLAQALSAIGDTLGEAMGGSSGILYNLACK